MFLIIVFIGSMVIANTLIHIFGPWFSPINALLLIGLDMVVRDRLHDMWLGKNALIRMGCLVLLSSVITYLLNPTMVSIAMASSLAFAGAMLINTAIYHVIQKRKWMVRSNVSNIGGSLTDSVMFPTIAFGAFMPEIVVLQFTAKLFGGFVWSAVFKKVFNLK